MTDTPILQFRPTPTQALIEFRDNALRFLVSGIEVFRLTPDGMEYKGQIVEDAGAAYREITNFFSVARAAVAGAIPLSDRLPTTTECDADGRCWVFDKGDRIENSCWRLIDRAWLKEIVETQARPELSNYSDYWRTMWLPYSALPTPGTAAET